MCSTTRGGEVLGHVIDDTRLDARLVGMPCLS
jgi:hypothetical protein